MSQNPPEGQMPQQTPADPPQMPQQAAVNPAQPVVVSAQGNGMAIAGMVLGIIAVLFAFIPFIGVITWVLAPLAIIFGAVGISKAKATGRGKGQAIAGVVLGVVALLIAIVWVAGFLTVLSDPEIVQEFEQISPQE